MVFYPLVHEFYRFGALKPRYCTTNKNHLLRVFSVHPLLGFSWYTLDIGHVICKAAARQRPCDLQRKASK